ncbi:MAG: secretin N-terminal domain-containing protein [Thermoanaerobaculales bacterium]
MMHKFTAVATGLVLACGFTFFAEGAGAEQTLSDGEQETLVIRTFVLEHAQTKDVDRLLRSLVEVRGLSSQPELDAIVIRDTAAKMAVIERLIEVVDQPRGEVDVDVELLSVRRKDDNPAADMRLAGDQVQALRQKEGTRTLARSAVSVMEGGSGRVHLEVGRSRTPLVRLDVTLRVRQHPTSGELTLDLTAELFHLDKPFASGDRAPIAWNQTESSLRLAAGETAVLRFPDTDPDREIAIALTPVVVRASGLDSPP